MLRPSDQIASVLSTEMGGEKADRGQMEPSLGHLREEHRELPCRPRRTDAPVGGVLRQSELLDAILEHRRIARWNVQLPSVHLGDVRE
jgi:hypothetical protein